MIKKKLNILISILFITSINCIAQKNDICGEVTYSKITNLGIVYQEQYLMKFNNKQSYSEEINVETFDSSQKTTELANNYGSINKTRLTTVGKSNLTSKFYLKLHDGFYFLDNFANQTLLVKEDDIQWNWKLHQETKKIGNFICQKATIKFRGREYTAWFTSDIPVPYGPWKFQGLSGLILEVYDTDKVLHITTNSIEINNNNNCETRVNNKYNLKEAMSMSEYLNKKEEIINEEFAKLASKMPKGFKPAKFDKNCEDCPKPLEIFNEQN